MKNLKVNFKAKTVTCKMFNQWGIFLELLAIGAIITTAVLWKTKHCYIYWPYCLIVAVAQFYTMGQLTIHPIFREETIPVDKIQKTAKIQRRGVKIFMILLVTLFVLNLYPIFCIILNWIINYNDIIFDYILKIKVSGFDLFVTLIISFIILMSYGLGIHNLYYGESGIKKTEPFLKSGLIKIAKEERESGISFWKMACKEQNDRGVAKRQRRLDKEEKERRYKELVASLEAESPGYNISSSIDFSDKLTHEFRVYGAIRKILIMGRLLAFEDILSYSTSDDPETHTTYETVREPGYSVTTTRKRGVGTRAALGHMMFGKAGALVGALTADEESTTVYHDIITEVETGSYTIHNFKMTINIRDEKAPTLTFGFDNNDVAFKMLTKVLDAIITQNLIEEIRRNTENPEPTDQLSNKQE